MKNNLIYCVLVAAILTTAGPLSAQDVVKSVQSAITKSDSNRLTNLSEEMVKSLLNKEFGSLMSGQSPAGLGNFASFKVVEAKADFSGNIIFKNGSVLGVKATGGVTEGLLPIFSNSKLNPSLGLGLQFSTLALSNEKIVIDATSNISYLLEADNYKKNAARELRELELNKELNATLGDSIKLILKRQQMLARQQELMRSKSSKTIKKGAEEIALSGTEIALISNIMDSIGIELTLLQLDSTRLSDKLSLLRDPTYRAYRRFTEAKEKRVAAYEKMKSGIKTEGFLINWFTFGYKINTNSFILFDTSQMFNSQISKKNFTSHEIQAMYSVYQVKPEPLKSYYAGFGLAVKFDDNQEGLDDIEISEVKNYGQQPGDRSSQKKYTAYLGAYENDVIQVRFFADFYWFLTVEKSVAFHCYPDIRFISNDGSTINNGLGLFFSFKDSNDSKSVVNAELYADLLDITNEKESTDNLLKRSTLGLRFTFPIKFKTNM